jgi:hypothetical protein
MSQFEHRENFKFCQKLGKSASETFQMIKQVYGEETFCHSAVFKWHKRFAQGETDLKMMSIPVGQELSEMNSRSKKLQCWYVPTAPKQQMKLQQQQQQG